MVSGSKQPQRRSVKGAKRAVAPPPSPSQGGASRVSTVRSSEPARARKGSPKKAKSYEKNIKRRYDGKRDPQRVVKQKTGLRWPQFIFLFLLLVLVIVGGLFSWDRWFRYDDIQEMRGQWTLENAAQPTTILINDSVIRFAENIEYSYTLDTWSKTIYFSFGNESGSGKYRFSADRQTLVISDKAEDDWLTDIKVTLDQARPEEGYDPTTTSVLTGKQPLPPEEQTPPQSLAPSTSDEGVTPDPAPQTTPDSGVISDEPDASLPSNL